MAAVRKFDYAKVQKKAVQRLERFGREFTFVQLKSTPDNPAEPWFGSATPRDTPTSTLTIYGAFVEPESLERLSRQSVSGDFVKSGEQVIICSTLEDLTKFDEVIDSADESRWKIYNTQNLIPGPIAVIQYVRVQRRGKVTAVRGALL